MVVMARMGRVTEKWRGVDELRDVLGAEWMESACGLDTVMRGKQESRLPSRLMA